MENKKYPQTANEAAKEIILMLYDSTKELSEIDCKSMDVHEQIRKNGETILELYVNVWR